MAQTPLEVFIAARKRRRGSQRVLLAAPVNRVIVGSSEQARVDDLRMPAAQRVTLTLVSRNPPGSRRELRIKSINSRRVACATSSSVQSGKSALCSSSRTRRSSDPRTGSGASRLLKKSCMVPPIKDCGTWVAVDSARASNIFFDQIRQNVRLRHLLVPGFKSSSNWSGLKVPIRCSLV